MNDEPEARKLSRQETHDLGMIIKERTKVLKAHAQARAAECLAEFERNLASKFNWDQDDVWRRATEKAQQVVAEAQKKIEERCKELGIPARFAPGLVLSWQSRGENAINHRRVELTRVAKATVDSMLKAAVGKIENQSLDLRTQIVAMGELSGSARLFLESLAPVNEVMTGLDFGDVEKKLEAEHAKRLSDRRGGLAGYLE